jgi:fatty-acyl-CoA synthase
MLDEAHRYAQLAARTGTKLLRIFGGAIPAELTRDEAIAMARRHIRQLIKLCKPAGCRPLLETHDAWTCVPEISELLREFQPEDVGVLWDIEHTNRAGECARETVDGLKRYIQHVHFKDSLRVGGTNVPKLMGEGDLPLKACIAALRSMDYDGFISLETEKRWHAGAPDAEQSVPQFAAFMRRLWLDEASPSSTD